MAGVNKVILVGNLGKDPEIRNLDQATKVASFPLATTEVFRDKTGNKVEQTEWHNVVLWRNLADVAEKYLRKGNTVYIEGKIRTRSWEDKDGVKKYFTEIVADTMNMLGGKRDDSNSGPREASTYSQPSSSTISTPSAGPAESSSPAIQTGGPEEDLPF